jgi:hypothetical protein
VEIGASACIAQTAISFTVETIGAVNILGNAYSVTNAIPAVQLAIPLATVSVTLKLIRANH